jgi:hypothetical protein
MLEPVKHAGPSAIAELEALLHELRAIPGVVEKKPGVYYRKSRALLHFHEDPTGLYADVREADGDFARHRVQTKVERARLLRLVRSLVVADAP